MNKTNSSIDENEEALVGEVLSDDEVREKKQAIAKWQHSPVGFGSYITKSNDLIQRTKYSLPRNEQKVLFMLMSKIDQKNDKDASKYYSITFQRFCQVDRSAHGGYDLCTESERNYRKFGKSYLLGQERTRQ